MIDVSFWFTYSNFYYSYAMYHPQSKNSPRQENEQNTTDRTQQKDNYTPKNYHIPWKLMVGRWHVKFWECDIKKVFEIFLKWAHQYLAACCVKAFINDFCQMFLCETKTETAIWDSNGTSPLLAVGVFPFGKVEISVFCSTLPECKTVYQ